MSKELEVWTFITERLRCDERVVLLVVAESTGSSPGRAGYKMAISEDGSMCGSIGGGVMEVRLVDQAQASLSETGAVATGFPSVREQVHRKNDPNSSGMICSGKQTVIFRALTEGDLEIVEAASDAIRRARSSLLTITASNLTVEPAEAATQGRFEQLGDKDFIYTERLGCANQLFIIGGGHCALALSELMSKMDFRISIFDDRPALNTIEKNEFADEMSIVNGYGEIAAHIPDGDDVFVVVMTLGYATDAVVIRQLIDHNVKYLGVLGSKAKMATLMKELREEGFDAEKLARIRTPIGISINSRTPEEIAVSIAAEIIAIKNADD